MDDLLYETIVGILAFWIVLVVGFVMFICRMRMRRANDHSVNSLSNRSTEPTFTVGPTQRRIQIYYIGNWDSNSTSNVSPPNILNKVLAIVEDHPPSYEEILLNNRDSNGSAVGREISLVPMPQA